MTAPKTQQLWFEAPGQVAVRSVPLLMPGEGQVRVRSHCSAVSAGTELLVYRGQVPQTLALDETLDGMQHSTQYPLQYGYAAVGEVDALGSGVDPFWKGRRVFVFAPHASHVLARPEHLIPLPDDIAQEDAVFLANMETAVSLVHDAQPLLGERVAVLGLGIVGQLVCALLSRFPLDTLLAFDHVPERRRVAQSLGVTSVLSPDASARGQAGDADLILELTGVPEALNLAIELAGFASRIIVGSWYGTKSAPVILGGAAHRNRLSIRTSQVSTLAPALTGRWDKARRFDTAWDMLSRIRPSVLISQRVPLEEAATVYQTLDRAPGEILQAVFVYPSISP